MHITHADDEDPATTPVFHVREDLDRPDPHYLELYHRISERSEIQWLVDLAEKFSGTPSFLDLGCGMGGLARPLARRGFPVCGVDANTGMLDAARKAIEGVRFQSKFR